MARKELGTFARITFTAALLLEGCSNPVPTPKLSDQNSETLPSTIPTFNLVNCQKGPYDAVQTYTLGKGQEMRVGGIIKDNTGEYIDLTVTDEGLKIIHNPSLEVHPTNQGGREYRNRDLLIIMDQIPHPELSQFGVVVSVTCLLPQDQAPQVLN